LEDTNCDIRIFYINLPIGVPALAGIAYFMHFSTPHINFRERLRRFDWGGVLILTGSLVGLLYGVSGGGVLHSWSSVNIICALVFGTVGIFGFALHELWIAPHPMMPMRIFYNRTAASALLSSMINGVVLWAMIYYLILYVRTHISELTVLEADVLTVFDKPSAFPA
jgi:hypothetical protein